MNRVVERDHLADFSQTVAAYLNVLSATGDCLEQAFPDVGGPYRQRIHSLRSRVAFDANREAIKGSAQTLQAELKDYAGLASRVRAAHTVEMERRVQAFGELVENLNGLQAACGARMGALANRIESAPAAPDPEAFARRAQEQAGELRGLAREMNQETESMLARMREQMLELDRRLASIASTDPATGLLNRREFERQMEAHASLGATFTLLMFELSGPLGDEILRMVGAKLAAQFRHNDRVARWDAREFAVLFLGGEELARARSAQVAGSICGHYTLSNGQAVPIEARVRVVQPELVPA